MQFRKDNRLLVKKDFDFVFESPKRTKDSNFTVLYKENSKNYPRLGLIISKKNCKHASKRNKLKRIIRESFRNNISKLNGHDIVVLNKHIKEIKKTKEFNKFLEKNNLANALIISDEDSLKNISKSARNIKNIKLIKQEGTNIYDLFKYKNVIMTSSSVKKLQERILNEKN